MDTNPQLKTSPKYNPHVGRSPGEQAEQANADLSRVTQTRNQAPTGVLYVFVLTLAFKTETNR